MFHSRFYEPEELIKIQEENKYVNHPELYLKREVIVDERFFVKQLIYMIQGIETQLFIKVYDEVEFDSQKESILKVFHFSLTQDWRTVFTHLSYQTLRSCSETPVRVANLIHYLTSKSKIIYQNTSNLILKSFSEGIMQYIIRLTAQFTAMLTQLQKQSGNLSNRSQNQKQSVQLMNSQSQSQSQNQNLTLLKVSFLFEQKTALLSELVNIVSKVLPYMSSSAETSPTDNYLVIQILFDQFWRLMKLIELSALEKQQILLIFQNSLSFYITLIQNWIQMNPYLLDSQKNLHFFIKLSQVNFTLSKSLESQNYLKLKNDSHMTLQLREQASKNEEFVQLFFKLQNLLVEEYLPQMLKKQGLCILELGKIIQFIYLYFSTEEKPILAQYFNVEKEFQRLFELINKTTSKESNKSDLISIPNKSMFLNEQTSLKRRKPMSISERMNQKRRKPLRNIKVQQDNPYEMFPTTRGVFLDCETTVSRVNVVDNKIESNKKQVKSIFQTEMKDEALSMFESCQNFALKFQRTLSQIIEKLYERALYFFQQQSQKEFFKLQSHLNIPSQALILNKNPSLTQKRPSFFSAESSLGLLTNHERIISSISLTLIGIKKFMLYEQGDFFLQLISLVNTVFDSSCTKISRNLITSYIEEAIKSSSANDLPEQMKSKVSFLFLKKTKDNQIRQLRVWSVFSILYRPEFPANCIYNGEIMQSFGEVFNFIFNIKQYEFSLKKIWEEFKQNAKIETQYSLFQTKRHPFESKILAIRNNIHHFVNLIFGSIMITIEGLWEEYIQEINLSFLSNQSREFKQSRVNRKLHNPISLIQRTQLLLKNLRNQTIQNFTLSNSIILTGELLGKFKKLLRIQPDSREWNDVIFGQQIDYIGHQFMGVVQMAKSIQDIGDSICYNTQF